MARPERNNVDYFPFFCKEGKAMYYLETTYKNDGFATWVKILRELAVTNYHHLVLSDKVQLMYLASKCKIEVELLESIINDLCDLEEFDKELWTDYKIIWCEKFIESIQDAYKKRRNKCISKSSLLQSLRNRKPIISSPKVDLSNSEGSINPQSKLKETKRKETKVKSKSHSGKIPGKEKKEVTKFWKIYVNDWFEFYKKQFGANPTFKPADAKHLKFIVNQLEKISVSPEKPWTQEYALKVYHHFLNKAISDAWLKSNFLLTNLSTKFDSIVNNPNKKALKPMNQTVIEKMKQYD